MSLRWERFQTGTAGLTVLLVLLPGQPLAAQTPEASAPIGPEVRAAVVESVSETLRREYVLDVEAERMASHIEAQLARGAYAGIADPVAFAEALTRDLRAVYLDRHLAVLPPERFRAFQSMVAGDHGPGEHAGGRTLDVVSRVMNRDGRTDVGYLKLSHFDGSAAGIAAIDTAMRDLAEVDAMIVDLRSSPGGDADAVRALSSYFFAAPTHLVSSIGRREASGQRPRTERWTTPNALSERLADTPLYLLIDGGTFSAAESFAFGLQRTSRAVLVGAATGGGGHMNDAFELAAGFGASVSVGRTFDPRTGDGWQSTGVTPTVDVQPDHALHTALTMIADTASRTAALDTRAAGVHATLLQYADAWYLGERSHMREVLDTLYTGVRIVPGGAATTSDAAALLARTDTGLGLHTPRELRNRQIAVLDVFGETASARLTLRETVHQMHLRWADGTWRITGELITPKPRHAGGH